MPTVPTRPGPKGADCDPLHHCHQMMLAPYYHMQINKTRLFQDGFSIYSSRAFQRYFLRCWACRCTLLVTSAAVDPKDSAKVVGRGG